MRTPKILSIPVENCGSHETIVLMVDNIPQSVETWNVIRDEKGNHTFYLTGVTTWQLFIHAGTMVQVIR